MFISILFLINKTAFFDFLLKLEYRSNIHILFILLIGPLFSGISVITYPLFFHPNRTKRVFFISAVVSLVNILITVPLIRILGSMGAALSFVFVNIIGIIIYLFSFRRVITIPAHLINWVMQLFLIAGFGILFLTYFHSDYLFLCFILIGAILSYRKINISVLWNKIKK
jgi:O-antigen/teichoic acid export membrane protein